MQQFFGLVNTLLAATPDAAARRLGMGTYRVIPISPAAGARAAWFFYGAPGKGQLHVTCGKCSRPQRVVLVYLRCCPIPAAHCLGGDAARLHMWQWPFEAMQRRGLGDFTWRRAARLVALCWHDSHMLMTASLLHYMHAGDRAVVHVLGLGSSFDLEGCVSQYAA